MERAFIAPDRRWWLVRPRPATRAYELGTHVILEFITDGETRILSCLREEWEVAAPDFRGLLARSVTTGASHAIHPNERAPDRAGR